MSLIRARIKTNEVAAVSSGFAEPWNAPLRTFHTSKDAIGGNPAGDDSNAGTSEAVPFATIQRGHNACDTAGDQLLVRESASPYVEPYHTFGADYRGMTITAQGTATDFIHIENYPNELPEIEQGLTAITTYDVDLTTADGTYQCRGIYVASGTQYVKIRGFRIKNCAEQGIFCAPSGSITGLYVEHVEVVDIYGESANNLAGIRFDNVHGGVIRNCIIHGIYNLSGSSNPYTAEPYDFDAAIHGYFAGDCKFYNNKIYHAAKGIFQKSANILGEDSHEIFRNEFHSLTEEMVSYQIQGSGSDPILNAIVRENTGYNVGHLINTDDLHTIPSQSITLLIKNNTVVNASYIGGINGVNNVDIIDNIFSGITSSEFTLYARSGTTPLAKIRTMNYNTFHNVTTFKMILAYNNGGGTQEEYASLTAWRTAFDDSALGVSQLTNNPDVNSTTTDPLITDAANGNFTLGGASPDKNNSSTGGERGAHGLGATGTGAGGIGVDWAIGEAA